MPARKKKQTESEEVIFRGNINKAAKRNFDFRKCIFEGPCMELAAMSIPPKATLGEETHKHADEILVVVQGKGKATIDGQTERLHRHDAIFITAGQRHDLKNTGQRDLKLLSVCSPPSEKIAAGVHKTGARALEEQLRHAWEQ